MNAETAEAYLAQFTGAYEQDDTIDMDLFEETIAAAGAAPLYSTSAPSSSSSSLLEELHPTTSTRVNQSRSRHHAGAASYYDVIVAQSVRMVCDDYVTKFMTDSNCITDLRESLHACQHTLQHMEGVLETFVSKLFDLQGEMVELKTRAMRNTLALDHAKSVQTVLQSVISHLLVPPDVIQVIVGTGTEELGMQFLCSLRKLHKLLRSRNGKWKTTNASAQKKGPPPHSSMHQGAKKGEGSLRSSGFTLPHEGSLALATSSNGVREGAITEPNAVGSSSNHILMLKLATLLAPRLPIAPTNSSAALEAYAFLHKELHHLHHLASSSQTTPTDPVASFIVSTIPDWTREVKWQREEEEEQGSNDSDQVFSSPSAEEHFYAWLCEKVEGFGGDLRDTVFGDSSSSSSGSEKLHFPITVSTLLTAFDRAAHVKGPDDSSSSGGGGAETANRIVSQIAASCGCQASHLQEWRDSYGERQRKCTQRLLDWLNDARYHAFRPMKDGGAGIAWPDALRREPQVPRTMLTWLARHNVPLTELRDGYIRWVPLVHEWFAHKGTRHQASAGHQFIRWLNTHVGAVAASLTTATVSNNSECGNPLALHHVSSSSSRKPSSSLSLAPSPSNDSLASSSASITANSDANSTSSAATRSVEIALRDCKAFREVQRVMDDLTIFACEKIRTFLIGKLSSVLLRQRTNISVQQENVLRPYAPLVHFLRHCAPYLRHRDEYGSGRGNMHSAGGGKSDDSAARFQLPFRIVRALYLELRAHYISIVSAIYFNKISTYISNCNALEVNSSSGSKSSSSSSSSSWTFFAGRSAAAPSSHQPLLTDPSGRVGPSDFGLGQRGEIFQRMFGIPVIPHVHAAKSLRHDYAETFRSLNVLLCDAVTREYLFTVDFFAGDATVYADVFQTTIQLVVDYVSEVLLQNQQQQNTSSSSSPQSHRRPTTSVISSCNKDVCGLLVLIRQCHIFRFLMTKVRRLPCLDGFYDSILMLLWPAFKEAFEQQLAAMKNITSKQIMHFLDNAGGHSADEKFATVHPITLRYAEFSAALMSLGTLNEEAPHVSIPIGSSSDHLAGLDDETSSSSSFDQGHFLGAAQRRIRSIVAENDRAESVSRFAVLQSNLSFLRVEFLRIIQAATRELCSQQQSAAAAAPAHSHQVVGHKVSAVFMLNNLFHVHAVWSGTKQLPTGLTTEQLASAFAPNIPLSSPSAMTGGVEEKSSHPSAHRESSAVEDSSFADDRTSSPSSPKSSSQPTNGAASAPRTFSGLTESPDFANLHELLLSARSQFVDQALRLVFPNLVALILDDGAEDTTPLATHSKHSPTRVAEYFSHSWRDGVVALHRDIVLRFVSHPQCQRECLVALSSQLLLYNTRLHHLATTTRREEEDLSSEEGKKTGVDCLVSQQLLMHHIRAVFRV